MTPLQGYVVELTKTGVIIALPFGKRVELKTTKQLDYGQRVWVAYNFKTRKAVNVYLENEDHRPSIQQDFILGDEEGV